MVEQVNEVDLPAVTAIEEVFIGTKSSSTKNLMISGGTREKD